METVNSHQTSETFDINIADYEQLNPDEQREYLENAYNQEQESTELPFRATTVLKIGNIALEAPEQLEDQIQEEKEDDDKEQEIDFNQYLAEAQKIITRLYMGDESALSALPPDFQEALKARMEYRKKQLEDESITEGFMQEELDKMCSVASVGLAVMRNPQLQN